MINLTSSAEKNIFRHIYFMRLAVVSLIIFALLVVIHTVLLIPSYAFLRVRVDTQQTQYERIVQTQEGSDSDAAQARLVELQEDVALLEGLPETVSFVGGVQTLLSVAHGGVLLTSITYTPGTEMDELVVRGSATNRDALRNYAENIGAQKGVDSVDFPISDLAQEKDLSFTLTITATL